MATVFTQIELFLTESQNTAERRWQFMHNLPRKHIKYTLTEKAIAILLSLILLMGSASGIMTGFDEQENENSQIAPFNEIIPYSTQPVSYRVIGGNTGNGTLIVQDYPAESGGGTSILDPFRVNVPDSASIIFVATPNPGFRVDAWTISTGTLSGSATDSSRSTTVNSPITVTVSFTPANFEIHFTDTNISASYVEDSRPISSGNEVPAGAHVALSAPAPGGNFFVRWFAHNGKTQTDINPAVIGTGNAVDFTMPSHDVFIERRLIPGYTVSYGVVGTHIGSISATYNNPPTYTPVTSGDVVENGTSVVFTAVPPAGSFRVAAWTVNGTPRAADASSGGNKLTLDSVNADTDVRVRFERLSLNLSSDEITINTLGTINITVSLTGDFTGDVTPTGSLTAVPVAPLPTGLTVTPSGTTMLTVLSTSYLTDAANTEGTPIEVTISLDGVEKTLLIHIDLPFLEILPPKKID